MAVITGAMAMTMMSGCGAGASNSSAVPSSASSSSVTVQESSVVEKRSEEKEVLRVGMECAYAPFNWTQDSPSTSVRLVRPALPSVPNSTSRVAFRVRCSTALVCRNRPSSSPSTPTKTRPSIQSPITLSPATWRKCFPKSSNLTRLIRNNHGKFL